MTDRRMSLSAPLRRGWDRMVGMLFRPFDLGKWLVVGFAAWLAGLAEGGSGFGFQGDLDGGESAGSGTGGVEDVLAAALEGWEWLLAHELVAGLIVAIALALIVLAVLVIWLSSRGKFVFLDNVVHDRAEIARPWSRYRKAGNSLFFFRMLVGLAFMAAMALLIGGGFWIAASSGGWEALEGAAAVATVAVVFVVGGCVGIAALYLFFFLDAFVVPLMHRYDLPVLAAWRRFFTVARGRWGWFLLSGLFVFVLMMLAGFAVVVTGVLTCCLGFVLLVIPYVGTVVLLPLHVTYRAFTVEFLAQADPELLPEASVE